MKDREESWEDPGHMDYTCVRCTVDHKNPGDPSPAMLLLG